VPFFSPLFSRFFPLLQASLGRDVARDGRLFSPPSRFPFDLDTKFSPQSDVEFVGCSLVQPPSSRPIFLSPPHESFSFPDQQDFRGQTSYRSTLPLERTRLTVPEYLPYRLATKRGVLTDRSLVHHLFEVEPDVAGNPMSRNSRDVAGDACSDVSSALFSHPFSFFPSAWYRLMWRIWYQLVASLSALVFFAFLSASS